MWKAWYLFRGTYESFKGMAMQLHSDGHILYTVVLLTVSISMGHIETLYFQPNPLHSEGFVTVGFAQATLWAWTMKLTVSDLYFSAENLGKSLHGSIIAWPTFPLYHTFWPVEKHILSAGARSPTLCGWVGCCVLWPSDRDVAACLADKKYSRHLHLRAPTVRVAPERLDLSNLSDRRVHCVWFYLQWNSYPGELLPATPSLSPGIKET